MQSKISRIPEESAKFDVMVQTIEIESGSNVEKEKADKHLKETKKLEKEIISNVLDPEKTKQKDIATKFTSNMFYGNDTPALITNEFNIYNRETMKNTVKGIPLTTEQLNHIVLEFLQIRQFTKPETCQCKTRAHFLMKTVCSLDRQKDDQRNCY